jgi:hypothetical protein
VVELPIERGLGWRVPINKVDQAQSDMDYLSTINDEGAIQSKIDIETEWLGEFYANAASCNHGANAGKKSGGYNIGVTGAPVAIDQTNALVYLMMLNAVSIEARMPQDAGLYCIIPSWYAYLLGISDLKNASFSGLGQSTVISGAIPKVMANFQLIVTDLYTSISDTGHDCVPITFGHQSVSTFAAQLSAMETVPTIKDFGQTVQALTVYDWGCINGDGVGYGYAYKNA